MRRTARLSAVIAQSFMDSGRVADEFRPGLRKLIRTDVLVLLISGIVLIAGGVVGFLFQQYLVATILLVVGAILALGAVVLWWISA